jgi:hypothetical protein
LRGDVSDVSYLHVSPFFLNRQRTGNAFFDLIGQEGMLKRSRDRPLNP